MEKWAETKREKVLKSRVFQYDKVYRQSPLTKDIGQFDLLVCPNWVNIIAKNSSDEIVMVKQFRHGTNEYTLEIPGGAVETNEDSLTAAIRECQEETGYIGSNWQKLGRVSANPAFMNNYCDSYYCDVLNKPGKQNLDPWEEIEIELVPLSSINKLIKEGVIHHSLIIAAFQLLSIR